MSLASHLVDRLEEIVGTWTKALLTLPDSELRNQREAIRARCEHTVGASPAALMLAALDAEVERRRRPGELPL